MHLPLWLPDHALLAWDDGQFNPPKFLAPCALSVQNIPMTRRGYFVRLAISLAIDLFDTLLGRLPIFGTVTEGIGSVVLYFLWGPAGLAYLWELADVTDQLDGFIPTATLMGLYVGSRNGMLTGKAKTDSPNADSHVQR